MTGIPNRQTTDGAPHTCKAGIPPASSDYYPAWLDNLADDVSIEGSLLDGAAVGPGAVRTIVGAIRTLYDRQVFNFAGGYGDNGWLEDYTAQVRGGLIGCAVLVSSNAAGQTQHVAANYRPRCSLPLLSRLVGEKVAGTRTPSTAPAIARRGVHGSLVLGTCFAIALCLLWIYFDLADTFVLDRGALGIVYLYGHNPLLAGVAAFGAGARLAVIDATHRSLTTGTRWALAGGIASFALALALLHIGAEWTLLRDPTFIGRLVLGALAIGIAAFGTGMSPLVFVLLLAAAVLAQLLVKAFTFPAGAASVWEPIAPVEDGGRPKRQAIA